MKKGSLGLLLLVSSCTLLTMSCGGGSRGVPAVDRNGDPSANEAAANSEQAKLHLGAFQELAGSDYLIAPITSASSREEYIKDASSSREENRYTRNFLFVNLADQSSHLLFPGHDLLILSSENLLEKPAPKPAEAAAKNPPPQDGDKAAEKAVNAVKWICYRVIKADTNLDKLLNANDLITIAISDVSGLNYTELLTDVRAVLHQTRRGDGLSFIYIADGKNQIAEIDLQTKKLVASKPLQEIVPR
jgi:hypothetical protein